MAPAERIELAAITSEIIEVLVQNDGSLFPFLFVGCSSPKLRGLQLLLTIFL